MWHGARCCRFLILHKAISRRSPGDLRAISGRSPCRLLRGGNEAGKANALPTRRQREADARAFPSEVAALSSAGDGVCDGVGFQWDDLFSMGLVGVPRRAHLQAKRRGVCDGVGFQWDDLFSMELLGVPRCAHLQTKRRGVCTGVGFQWDDFFSMELVGVPRSAHLQVKRRGVCDGVGFPWDD